jgi:predicted glycogen debranching enzyme
MLSSNSRSGNRPSRNDDQLEWLVTNDAGSFAIGCVDRIPRRQYHAALTVREPPQGETLNLLVDVVEIIEVGDARFLLAADGYDVAPAGVAVAERVSFTTGRSVVWVYRCGDMTVQRELALMPDTDTVVLRYRFSGTQFSTVVTPVAVQLIPLLRCRPWHTLTHSNPFLNGAVAPEGVGFVMQPYPETPKVHCSLTGVTSRFELEGCWHGNVRYPMERERGYDDSEDVFSPGAWLFTVDAKTVDADANIELRIGEACSAPSVALEPCAQEELLDSAADCYLMHSRSGAEAIVAGFPWFGAWGRDTMIALRGLCLDRGCAERALPILDYHLAHRINGLIPNILPVGGVPADTNALDATLLCIRAVQQVAEALGSDAVMQWMPAVCEMLDVIGDGSDGRFHVMENGLLCIAPEHGAMTWMDAQCDGRPVTPRHGLVVEINALWLNGLQFAVDWARDADPAFVWRWFDRLATGLDAFQSTFWLPSLGYLADTVEPGAEPTGSLRPNQLWALALPTGLVDDDVALSVLDIVEHELLTPVGLRTLSPHDPAYCGRYHGEQRQRDLAYHNGTVWPWLLGIYADAALCYQGKQTTEELLTPVLERLEQHLFTEGCIGQISEVFDGDAPHACGGAPAQAWSVAELIHVMKVIEA